MQFNIIEPKNELLLKDEFEKELNEIKNYDIKPDEYYKVKKYIEESKKIFFDMFYKHFDKKCIAQIQKSIINEYSLQENKKITIKYIYDKFIYDIDRVYLSNLNSIGFFIKPIDANIIKMVVSEYTNTYNGKTIYAVEKKYHNNRMLKGLNTIQWIGAYLNAYSPFPISEIQYETEKLRVNILNFFTDEDKNKVKQHFSKYISSDVSFNINIYTFQFEFKINT